MTVPAHNTIAHGDQSTLGEVLVDLEDLPPVKLEPEPRSKLLLAASLVLIAFNIRIVFSSLSTVLPEIMRTNNLSASGASILTTLPVLCMGLFSFAAPGLAQRYSAERVILGSMAVLTIGTSLRGFQTTPTLFLAALLTGSSIAMINVLLPGLVKRDFPGKAPLMTGLYTMALCLGAASAAALTVPIERIFNHSWATALAVWAIPGVLVTALWAPYAIAAQPARRNMVFVVRGLMKDRLAWQVTLFMGLQSALAYITFGWLAPILRDRGLDDVSAGVALSISVLGQMIACLFVPSIAMRFRDQKLVNVLLCAAAAVSFIGCAVLPLSTVWVLVALLGLSQGGMLSMGMTAIIMRAPDIHVAAKLSGMVQGVGYTLAALGPLLVGMLHGWSGTFASTAILFAALAAGSGINGWAAGSNRHVNVRAEQVQ